MGSSPFNSSTYSDFVSNVDAKFLDTISKVKPDLVRSLFTDLGWQEGDPKLITFRSYALPAIAQRADEGNQAVQFNVDQGYSLNKTFFSFMGKWNYTLDMQKFDQVKLVDDFSGNLVKTLNASVDMELTHQLFTYADSSTYSPYGKSYSVDITSGDGQPMASASHKYLANTSDTKSNILSGGGKLSLDNVTLLMRQMNKDTVDDKGDNVDIWANTCIIPNQPQMIRKAREIFGSPLTPETNNNAVNVFAPGNDLNMRLVVLKKGCFDNSNKYDATKEYRWGLMDSSFTPSFQYATAGAPETMPKTSQDDNIIFSILGYQFVAYGCPRWQGITYSLSTTQP